MTTDFNEIRPDYDEIIADVKAKQRKCRFQREILLNDFVENFSLDNLADVDKYDKALRILRISEKILEVKIQQLLIMKKRSKNEK